MNAVRPAANTKRIKRLHCVLIQLLLAHKSTLHPEAVSISTAHNTDVLLQEALDVFHDCISRVALQSSLFLFVLQTGAGVPAA